MGVRILFDSDEDMACLYDSVTMTAFGHIFEGDGAFEKQEAFLRWYEQHGKEKDVRLEKNAGTVQDEWLATLDKGCRKCIAEPWEACDEYAAPHERVGR